MNMVLQVGPASNAAHTAMLMIQKRFGDSVAPDDQLAFHGISHTAGVLRRALTLAHAIGLPEKDVELVAIAASFHDVVQEWEENPRPDGAVMRRRLIGKNEEASAVEAVHWMYDHGGYDDQAYALVTEAIRATVPAWDADRSTVRQPNLRPDSHPIVRCVALADLGLSGMEGAVSVGECDQLFREEQLDVARMMRNVSQACQSVIAKRTVWNSLKTFWKGDKEAIQEVERVMPTTEKQDGFRARMLSWCKAQTQFVRGRQLSLEGELGTTFDAYTKNRIRNLFCCYNDAIAANEAAVARRETLSFWLLAQEMGFTIPKG